MKKRISTIAIAGFVFVLFAGLNSLLKAQNATDVLRYSLQYPSYDPVTMVMPGVAQATGFGAYQENPAVMALFDHSFMAGGLNDYYVTEESSYLGNPSTFDVNSLGISHAGFVYKFPTSRGSLVIGGGYSQSTVYSRAISGYGFNKSTTITDYYAMGSMKNISIDEDTNYLVDAAFDAFAIDKNNEGTGLKSILRFPDYLGMRQSFETTKTGTLGEYSAFVATELVKNLMVGLSIGGMVGNYKYERNFLEKDEKDLYNTDFIDTNGDGITDTDINKISSEATVQETVTGFSARLGLVYQFSPHFNLGASYQFKNVLFIERITDVYITTTMDNSTFYSGDANTKYKYQITRPARLNIGFSIKNVSGFNFSAMVERVDYTSARIEFDELAASSDENAINSSIENNLDEVLNLRMGVEYMINNRFTVRGGYGYYPSPVRDKNFDRQLISGGLSAQINRNTVINVGVQYATWNDETRLYSTPKTDLFVNEKVHRWNIMAGITYYF